MNKKVTQQSKYEWIWYALSYLSVARISLERLKNDEYKEKIFQERLIYKDKFALIATIWNIKHAIELIVKSLGIIIDKKYLVSHNCKMVAEDLRRNPVLQKIYKPEKIDELAAIIDKYYRLDFWNKKLVTNKSILDVKNDIFRYPDNSQNFSLDIQALNSVGSSEIDELLKDVELLRRLRSIIDVQLQIIQRNKK